MDQMQRACREAVERADPDKPGDLLAVLKSIDRDVADAVARLAAAQRAPLSDR